MEKDPAPWWSDWDFSYLQGKPSNVRQTATIYEYSRQSDAVRTLVKKFGDGDGDHLPKGALKTASFTTDGLLALASCAWFPKWSFQRLLQEEQHKALCATEFGIDGVSMVSFSHLDILRANQAIFQGALDQVVAFKIPWAEYSDDELMQMIGKEISRIRPPNLPGPKKPPGRKGRGPTLRLDDFLNQLAAYRLDHLGLTQKGALAKGFGVYGSQPAWNTAVRAAKRRVADLLDVPLLWRKRPVSRSDEIAQIGI